MPAKFREVESTATLSWEKLRPRVTGTLLAGIAARIAKAVKPERIILFGSHAHGRPGMYSDVDLFVIMRSRESMPERMSRLREVAEVPFLPMDILVYTPAEVKERLRVGDAFVSEILTRGRTLYRRGEHRRMDRKGRG
ncbi:MAG: nucleotidyltransferase domain-containing protein [Planctomycetes bacterium]|nr:nucleotidyltransferase domain-containing protein [Planctomycetota bacterium]